MSLVFLWGSVAYIILYVEPDLLKDVFIPGLYLPFFGLVGIAIWYSLALILRRMWGSLLLTITLVGGMILSTQGLMFWGLGLALLLTLVIESWYIYMSHEKNRTVHEQKNRDSGI